MTGTIEIREAAATDAEQIWQIMREVISGGDTYAFAPDTPRDDMLAYWFARGAHPFVALVNGQVAGSYMFRSNQPGLGAHIANGAYMTAPVFQGHGIGKAMGLHSLKAARAHGFLGMQFNFVVKSNERAVALWLHLGFSIMAEIPNAYRHARNGFTSVYIMFRSLDDQ